ncbi:flagellar motor protein MotB [Oceanisphaera profunda]|uniref:Flagellar motor protein MotB n=1 Tax=Oceanisphaera profunda TaxID=1416627 RepID=A0A1Y0D2C2_9GAMM|nr:OmpA family protein [Oceanisphaera profunda]ART81672.1 flagellar motor protein MotB [Oceanisphaera profunda]
MKPWMLLVLISFLSGCSLTATPEQDTNAAYDLTDLDRDGVISARDNCLDSVSQAEVDNDGCGDKKYLALQQDIIILFDHDKSIIKSKYQSEINTMASFMAQHRELKLLIEGHTSRVGTEQYNLALSKRRAEVARSALINAGVESDRLEIIGFGETHPLLMGEGEQVAAANRRVVGALTSMTESARLRWNVYKVEQPSAN